VDARLDASFAVLADVTRRGILEQLGRTDASISDLAETFDMTLTGSALILDRGHDGGGTTAGTGSRTSTLSVAHCGSCEPRHSYISMSRNRTAPTSFSMET
jgi:DNA-binding transcriptional ArsR family regulator